jgi:hypothetical protein
MIGGSPQGSRDGNPQGVAGYILRSPGPLFAIERRVEKVGKKERETGEGEWVRERREERS